MYQAAGKAEPLLHAARKRIHIKLLFVRQIYDFQQIIDHASTLFIGNPICSSVKIHILRHFQVIVHPEEIRHVANPFP